MGRRRVASLDRTLAIALVLLAEQAAAQPAEQFFARKTVTITIGYTAGGSYDLYGRMVARHLGKHIPGQPTLIAQNMPGAGSLKAANYLYEVALSEVASEYTLLGKTADAKPVRLCGPVPEWPSVRAEPKSERPDFNTSMALTRYAFFVMAITCLGMRRS